MPQSAPAAVRPTQWIEPYDIVVACMYCERYQVSETEWSPAIDPHYQRPNVRVSHGICPPCLERALAEVE